MRLLTTLLIAAVLAFGWLPPGTAQDDRRPLLMPGKETVYQRILTRPGATLHAAPDGPVERGLPPLQPYYVFAAADGWLEIGSDSRGPAAGWTAAEKAVEWKQNIVVAFANPANRERTLLFDTKEDLDRLINHESALSLAREYREAAEAGAPVEGSGVVSIEPAEHIDIDRNFYILPILDWVQEFHPFTAEPFLSLNVASLPATDRPILEETRQVNAAGALSAFSVGIVFVIDTTISMQPYIDETHAAVRRIYERISGSPVADKVSFGVIGFRDNTEARPDLGYTTKVFLPLEREQSPEGVLAAFAEARAAETSSVGFAEDSIAGLEDAILLPGWDEAEPGFGGRYVILITDAGPKNPDDPLARSPLRPAELQVRAEENGIAVLALHLLTPEGAPNHASAAAAYNEITRFAGSDPFYFPVADGDPQAFRAEVDSLAERLIGQIQEARALAEAPPAAPTAAPESAPGDALDQLGLAMRLAYLGRAMETQAPDLFSAWMADSAIEDPTRLAVSVRLLLTKNQLSTMRDVMQAILEAGETTQSGLAPEQFFDQLKSAVAQLAQDPDRLVRTDFADLGSALGEFLGDLPYNSQVMEMTEERWLTAGTERREFLDGLRSKLAYYEMLHDDPTKWTVLDEAASPGEAVTAMPFSLLP